LSGAKHFSNDYVDIDGTQRPNRSWCPMVLGEESIMAMLKKKTRKAIRKSFKKIINKQAPIVAEHMATALVAGLATYLGAEGKKGAKQIKKAVKHLPAGKHLARAVGGFVPAVKDAAHKLPGLNNGGGERKKRGHSKKSVSAS
jgi:hypothetical protein